MASVINFWVPNFLATNYNCRARGALQVHCLGGRDSTVLSSDSVEVNEWSLIEEKQKGDVLVDGGNGRLKSKPKVEKKSVKDDMVSKHLDLLWDDGYGTSTVKDYLEEAKEIIKPDGGPPRWFCPIECGQPLPDSPVLLFLPGLDGIGLGLILHHKPLGRVFEVRCLHIPIQDRTPFEGLLKFVEETVRLEHALSPGKPIYLVGDSFGGCLALAVAARIPTVDLILILVNPATSFCRSQLQPILPVLEALPNELHVTVPYFLSFVLGDPMKMAMVGIEYRLPPRLQIEQLRDNLLGLLPHLSGLSNIIPKHTLLWKLKLLETASSYANSRLHAVKAEVLLLASGKDNMLPSRDEAQRLKNSLQNCIVRLFKENGHALLLECNVSLLTIVRGTCKYRRLKRRDYVKDFLPPSMSEFKYGFDEVVGLLRFATGATFLSTLKDGKIVKGLAGVPNKGPVLFVGYHNLLGVEIYSLVEEFLREKKIMVHGLSHPSLFSEEIETSSEFSVMDWLKVMGAVPVTAINLFKLLSTKSHILLYPGGAREALHNKGEEYKLFWPDQPEFVRMAAQFGATIVPFGAIGEDDIFELALDYNDYMKIPVLNDYIRDINRKTLRIRDESMGEVARREVFLPGLLPKIPGRLYYLFGKPIETKGMEEALRDKENAQKLYRQIKNEVESIIAYLLKKRQNDPYRNVLDRTLYRMLHSPLHEVPAFEP